MDPTTSAHTNPFVSPPTNQTFQSELGEPKAAHASAVDPAAASAGTAGLGNIAPLSGSGSGSAPAPAFSSSGFNTNTNTGSTGSSASAPSYPGLGEIRDPAYASGANTKAATQQTAQDLSARTSSASQNASNTAQDVAHNASATAQDAAANARASAQNLSNKTAATANDAATGIRQRVRKLSVQLDQAYDHPAVKNAKGVANRNVAQLREQLGRSKTVRELEARTGVDRVVLVVGSVLAYLLLVPLNLFGLALPTTNILTILPAAYLAIELLESSDTNDQRVKALLAYFVVLGAIQTAESLAGGVLAKRIPQYHTVKLLALAYLLHPKTNGALKVHESVFRPISQRAAANTKSTPPPSVSSTNRYSANSATTPPTSKPSLSTVNSPAQQPTAQTGGYTVAGSHAQSQSQSLQGAVGTVPVVVQVPFTAEVADIARDQY